MYIYRRENYRYLVYALYIPNLLESFILKYFPPLRNRKI